MRAALTLAAAVTINVVALGALEWTVTHAQLPPAGEVIITQLEAPGEVAQLAQVRIDAQARTAKSL